MSFSILFTADTETKNNPGSDTAVAQCCIQFGDKVKYFSSPTEVWRPEDYYSQWISAIKNMLEGKSKNAALITEYYPLDKLPSSFRIIMLYKEGNRIAIDERSVLNPKDVLNAPDITAYYPYRIADYLPEDRDFFDYEEIDTPPVEEIFVTVEDVDQWLAKVSQ